MSTVHPASCITPFLWFDKNAEEAVNFYLGIFPNSQRTRTLQPADAQGRPGKVITISFQLDGQNFMALNGGPIHHFNEAVSFVVSCENQFDVDHYWSKLSEGGKEGPCGWLKDKFGLSWQVIPKQLPALIQNPKAMEAMLQMKKIDLAALESAAHS